MTTKWIVAVLCVLVSQVASADPIEVTILNYGANFAPVMIAEDEGYFKDEGLEVEVVLSGGGTVTAALISGDIQYSSSPDSAMSAIREDLLGSVKDQNVAGSMSLDAAAKEIALRGELLGLAPDKITPAEKVYDFSIVADADTSLAASGWKPVK